MKLVSKHEGGSTFSISTPGEIPDPFKRILINVEGPLNKPQDKVDSCLNPPYQSHDGLYGMEHKYYLEDYGIGGWLIGMGSLFKKPPKKKRDINLVYSFWTKPFRPTKNNFRPTGGFEEEKWHWACWALSVLQASKFYKNIHLYTDNLGKSILCDTLGLPFTKVDTSLEKIVGVNENFWAYGKMVAYSKQEEPFINIDGDVILWQPLPTELEKAPIICQDIECQEFMDLHYIPPIALADEHLMHFPKAWVRDRLKRTRRNVTHVGIIGGNSLNIIKDYVNQADELLFHPFNEVGWEELYEKGGGGMLAWFNTIYEQYLLSAVCRDHEVVPQTLIPNNKRSDIDYITKLGYTHLMGGMAKKNKDVLDRIEKVLRLQHPQVWEIIEKLVKNELYRRPEKTN